MFKKSLKIFLGIIVFLGVLIFYLLSDFNPLYRNKEFVLLANKLNEAKKEDFTSFIDIHNKIYKKIKERSCPCRDA